ncbi:LOW QUALITY PROTEIN: hypothetical protein HJC23_008226 [Cyclotella cryptica]|uniref:ATP-dependent rRNA helicase SPB4-like C-terminal extension domain-containing protein n=1 Tax=Cyclotella cryptica TaxID=29204 RepID=A0ABD3Q6X9_9STRA
MSSAASSPPIAVPCTTVATRKSASTKKSSRPDPSCSESSHPDPNEHTNPFAIIPCKPSVNLPSTARSVCEEPNALVAYTHNDPPSTTVQRIELSTCKETDDEDPHLPTSYHSDTHTTPPDDTPTNPTSAAKGDHQATRTTMPLEPWRMPPTPSSISPRMPWPFMTMEILLSPPWDREGALVRSSGRDLDSGILCATDAARRDLDIPPSVDWVFQFKPPDDPTEYILGVARISCDSHRCYHLASIPVSEFEIPKLAEIQIQIEFHVNESDRFLKYAKDAYGSYLIAYASHTFWDVYNVHDLNKNDVVAAFGLLSLPSLCDGSDDEVSEGSSESRDYQAAGQAPKEGSRRTCSLNKKKKEKT